MGERRGTKALELWCRRITEGYPGVNIQNMTTSWKDGLAFCAMIHHFRPDLIDFDSLNKDDVYGNNELAFRTAEQHLGIPALLDAEDMASCTVPDRLSILTYISQFYQSFGGSSPSRLATSRTTETTNERIDQVPESPKNKVGSRLGMRRDPCTACGLPVFLAEKLLIDRAPYHRTCFRCARCGNQLTPGNYYETEEGRYCCETCPDEVTTSSPEVTHRNSGRLNEENLTVSGYQRSLSDEEKVLEVQGRTTVPDVAIPDLISQTSRLRLDFMANHMLTERNDENHSSLEKGTSNENENENENTTEITSVFPDDDEEENDEEVEENFHQSNDDATDERSKSVQKISNVDNKNSQESKAISLNDVDTSDKYVNVDHNENTKDGSNRSVKDKYEEKRESDEEDDKPSTLFKKRLKMFEDRGKRQNDENDGRKISLEPGISVKRCLDKSIPSLINENQKSLDENSSKFDSNESKDFLPLEKKEEAQISIEETDASVSNIDEGISRSELTQKEISDEENKVKSDSLLETSLTKAKGIDLSTNSEYPEDLNPFKSDEDEEEICRTDRDTRVSTNPFDSDDDEEADEKQGKWIVPPKPAIRNNVTNKSATRPIVDLPVKVRLPAPQINLNPFWSDDEDEEHDSDLDDKGKSTPVPRPRTIKNTVESGITQRNSDLSRGGMYASNSSIKSSESTITTPGGTCRKKKPAPQPPTSKDTFVSESYETSDCRNSSSPRTTPRARKTKPAPPPPLSTSTPRNIPTDVPIITTDIPIMTTESPDVIESHDVKEKYRYSLWEDQKTNKDEANRNRQSLVGLTPPGDGLAHKSYTDKSVHGKWKRKKGPAPPRPIPHRRKIKVMSMKDVKLELDEIELQQQGLERQGVRLERLIRDKCETGNSNDETSLGTDVEELVLELFALVNEKNELFRRQAELMLLRRQQRLEEEHAEIEYQIRCLMCQSEATKTDFDKQREEALIQRLIEIVERRNEIVECLEMDRRREIEEDRSIHKHMDLFAARNKNTASGNNDDSSRSSKSKKGKIKEKLKEKRSKKAMNKDADKDVDETEVKPKRHNKKKWF